MEQQPTIVEIDEALNHLRLAYHRHDGDAVKQAFVMQYMNDPLEQRQALLVTA